MLREWLRSFLLLFVAVFRFILSELFVLLLPPELVSSSSLFVAILAFLLLVLPPLFDCMVDFFFSRPTLGIIFVILIFHGKGAAGILSFCLLLLHFKANTGRCVHLAQDEVEKIATTSKLLPREKVALSTMAKYAYAPLSVVSVMFLLLCFPF